MCPRIGITAALIAMSWLAVSCKPKTEAPPPPEPAATTQQPGESEATEQPTATAAAAASEVMEGKYVVCDVGTHEKHPKYTGPHLAKGDEVVISTLDVLTPVKLKGKDVDMILSSDKSELTSPPQEYAHQNTETGQTENVKHIVHITNDSNSNSPPKDYLGDGLCNPGKNIIKVTFCFKEAEKWQCKATPGHHLGDVHAQN
jgi:hypothetical protein